MIVHLFPKTQFTEDYILFIKNHFDPKEHRFILYSNKQFKLADSVYALENVFDYDERSIRWLFRQLIQANGIVIHNLSLLFKELALFSMNKKLIRKTVWMIWGSDLYCYRNPINTIGDRLTEYFRRRIATNIRYSATLASGDHELLCEWYNCSPCNFRLEYIPERAIERMKTNMLKDRDRHDKVRVMLGNSASRTNCHIEVLEMLAKYKDEDIEVITPLSYGDMEYAEEVKMAGRDLLGDAFVPLTEFVPKMEYYDFLSTIDIGIFNNNRQEATGNIEALMFYKRRTFIRRGTSMWNEWDKEGYLLEDVADITQMSFDEFCRPDCDRIENNYSKVSEYYDADARAKEWKVLFDILDAKN